MPRYVAPRIATARNRDLKAINGSKVVNLDASYKPKIGDAPETSSVPFVRLLTALGAEVTAVDPYAYPAEIRLNGVLIVREVDESLLAGADLVERL